MKTIILSAIVRASAMALHKPYWSATPLKESPDYKQIHMVLTHINYNLAFGIGKTKVSLDHVLDELTSHTVDISKHVKHSQLNATLDVGYFTIPNTVARYTPTGILTNPKLPFQVLMVTTLIRKVDFWFIG